MHQGHRIVLLIAVLGIAAWTAMPLLSEMHLPEPMPATASPTSSGLNVFLGRIAVFASFLAGMALIGHTLAKLRWSEGRTRHLDTLLKTARDVVPFEHDEADRYALLREAASRLKRARGYESVWMACLDEDGLAGAAVQDGCSGAFGSLWEDMQRGSWPPCAQQALGKSGPVLIRDIVASCAGCHLQERRYGRGAVAVRLETEGRVFGVMCVKSTLDSLRREDEQGVLARVSSDMGHALKSIELERKRSETADELAFRIALGDAVARCITASLGSELPVYPVAESVIENLIRLTESRAAAAYRLDPLTGSLVLVRARSEEGERSPDHSRFPAQLECAEEDRGRRTWGIESGSPEATIRNGDPTEGLAAGPGEGRPGDGKPLSSIAAPALIGDRMVGLIVAVGSGRAYAERDRRTVEALADCYADACRDTESNEDLAVHRQAVSTSPFPILVTSPEGEVIYANSSLVELWGLESARSLVGSDHSVLWEDKELGDGVLRRLQESGAWSGELVARRADGSWVRVRVSASVSGPTGELPRRFVFSIMDLTEIRLSETTMRVFGRIAAKAASSDRPRDLFLEARQELGRVLDTRNFLIALLEPGGDRVLLPYFLDEKDQNQFTELPPGKTLIARVISTGKPLLVNSHDVEELSAAGEIDIIGTPCECWLGVPLMDGDTILGVMAVQSYASVEEYGDRETSVLAHAADIVASGLARMRAHGQLAESRGRSDAVAQTITNGLVDTDSRGHIISWNKAAESMFGYAAAEAIGRPFSLIVPEGFLQAHVDGLMRAVSSEGQGYVRASVEGVGLRKDGSEFPMELSIGAWRAGEETFFTAVLSDATSRKQTEEELQFLSSIPLQVSDALIVTDLNFRITYVNKAAEFLFSYPREELIGRTLDLLSVESWDETMRKEIHQTVSAGRFWSGSQRSRRKDGSSFVVEYRVSPLRDRAGRLTSYISIFHDITERRRGELLLQALNGAALGMERSLTPDQVLEAVGGELEKIGLSCAVLALDAEFATVSLSFASEGLAGIKTGPGETGAEPEITAIPLQDLPPILRTVEAKQSFLLEEGSSGAAGVAPETDSGHLLLRRLSEHSSIVVPLIAGLDVVGVLVVTSDSLSRRDIPAITAFGNQLAAAWRKANLLQELEGSLRELRRAQSILSHAQKMEAVGNLAGGVAHDFNNLLTAISGYTELLLARYCPEDEAYADLLEIKKAAQQASGVTGQLLAFSRQQPLEPRPVLVNDVVTDVDKMLRRLIGEDVDLVPVLDPEIGRVRADPTQLQQVIMNLAINARDAMPDGGTLTVRTETARVNARDAEAVPEAEPGDYVVLSVSDTGTGVEPSVLERIFEPFFTTKEPGKGTGLGLSVVYGIVSQHGGWIDVSSKPGKGTLFRVYLPMTAVVEVEEPDYEAITHRTSDLTGHHESVLIVEDEDTVRSFAARALRQGGYDVVEASSAEEAVGVLKEGRPVDLVFTDVILSSKSGLELVDEIRTLRPGIPALLSSGYTAQKAHWEVIQERGLPFLKKPYAVGDLLGRVRDLLDDTRSSDEPKRA